MNRGYARWILTISLTLSIMLRLSSPAQAATWQWDGGAGTGDWQTGANWNPDTGNPNFNGTFADRLNVNGAQELVYSAAEGITLYGTAGARGLVVGSGSLGSGTMRITGGTFSTANANQGDVIGNSGGNTGTLIIDGGIYVGTAAGFNLGIGGGPTCVLTLTANGGSVTVPAITMNNTTGAINLNGGTLTANALSRVAGTGTFNFNGGTYKAGAATAGFSGLSRANVRDGGAIIDTAGFDITMGQALLHSDIGGDAALDGGLTKRGSGQLVISADATFTGPVSIEAGNVKMSSRKTFLAGVDLAVADGTFLYLDGTSQTLGALTGLGTVGASWTAANLDTLTVGSGNAGCVFDGTIAGGDGITLSAIALTKVGTGSVTLNGANTFGGLTTVSGGELVAGHNTALGVSAGATVASGGRVVLADGISVSGESITVSGHGGNARGALQAASGATATWNGPVILQAGDSRVGAQANGTLVISGDIADGTGNELIVSADASTGKVVVSGTANSYTYATRIVRGTLQLGAHDTLPASALLDIHSASSVTDGAIFEMNGFNQRVRGLKRGNVSGPALLRNSSLSACVLTIETTTFSLAFDSPIEGNLSVVKEGSLTQELSGNNSYTGDTTVNDGTLRIAVTAALPSGTTVRVSGAGKLQLDANASATGLYLDGLATPAGTWGASGSGAVFSSSHFLGTGILTVSAGSPQGTIIVIR